MDILTAGIHKVTIDQGELISYRFQGMELIHQKGEPGWAHCDMEMFPIIGPTAATSYRVQVPKGNAIQDQHGLLRELDYTAVDSTEQSASYKRNYAAGAVVKNSKHPEKSPIPFLIWPYSFEFSKGFELDEEGLTIRFTISGDVDMPYMLGYHPAFHLNTSSPKIRSGEREISLTEVMEAGSQALEVPATKELLLSDQCTVQIKTDGFDTFMLWTEVPNMICIEPVTYYPYSRPQHELHEGFDYLQREEREYSVRIVPQK